LKTQFDRGYYEKYYHDSKTAAVSNAEMRARALLIAAYTAHVGLPVRRILDAGCGIGMLRAPLMRTLPRARYTGLEISEYLCQRYGWVQGTIDEYRPRAAFDLVICYDVLQYLDDRAAGRAIANFRRLCRGVLYFSALTSHDQSRTDRDVNLRSGEWYRARLARHFRRIGAGFWIRRDAPLVTWELESAG
jgi:2-polyprenyl-3-methyl-5-hydroxy-6-metoxy-1,4-benzoquinol methylase